MGIANAQRTLSYLRVITQFVSQEDYRDVVAMSVLRPGQLLSLVLR